MPRRADIRLIRLPVLLGFLAAMTVWPVSGLGQGADAPAAPGNSSGEALIFKHPRAGYLFALPPGVQLEDRGDERGIALKSRKGYLITIQTGKSKPGAQIHQLLARLEARYLGPGRPWSVKIDEKRSSIAGLDALEALYEGAGSRIRVVIARGRTLDYVFFFFSSLANFQKHQTDFNWLLDNFQPAAADRVTGNMGTPQKFEGAGLGYVMDYPEAWTFERPGGPAVVFSGKKGTPEYFATVNIQNVSGNNVAALIDKLKLDITTIDGAATFADENPFTYTKDGQNLQGFQFSVVYTKDGTRYRQWTVAIPRPGGDIVHLWSYAAPDDRFARFAPIAGKMLGSWTITQ